MADTIMTKVDVADGDTLFRDGFDPPGPRTSVAVNARWQSGTRSVPGP